MGLNNEQYRIVYRAVLQHQKTSISSYEYEQCEIILKELFDLIYTQRQEQPT
jgi:hypothetical protein